MYNNSFPILTSKTIDKKQNTEPDSDKTKRKWGNNYLCGEKKVHLLQNYLDKQIWKYFIEQIILSNIFLNLETKILINASRVHKLSCPDCGMAYLGQPGKSLKRSKEHHLSFRNNNTS